MVSGVGIAYVGAVGAVFSLVAGPLTLVTIKLARWERKRAAGVGADAILELDDGDRKETAYAMRTVYLLWEHLPLDDGRVGVYRAGAPHRARGRVCH